MTRNRNYYAIEYRRGVAFDCDGTHAGTVRKFISITRRRQWVDARRADHRTKPGWREAVLRRDLYASEIKSAS